MLSHITFLSALPGWFLLSASAFRSYTSEKTQEKRFRQTLVCLVGRARMGICAELFLGKFLFSSCQKGSHAVPQMGEDKRLHGHSFLSTFTLKKCSRYLQQEKNHIRISLSLLVSHFYIGQYSDVGAY